MLRHALTRHPDTPPSTVIERVEAAFDEDERGALRLSYRMVGDAQGVITTPLAHDRRPRRRDELWRHTCCELFVHDTVGSGYREYNFAPCGDWAAYRFSGYRTGRAVLEAAAPRIVLARSPERLALTVTLEDQPLDALRTGRVGIACVIETAGELSYWALAHPPGRPDFHHACAFASMPELQRSADSFDRLSI